MQQDEHPSKLIDLELLNLLKFCGDLFTTYKHNNEDYQEEIMLKSIELGKKQKQKVLVLDMDETMVSARFKSRMPPGFVTTFVVDFQDQPIHVRVRPYLQDCLERLSQLYEIVVFTAGVQEYADKILDQIDPERKIIKKRMYRQDCIQVQDFFVKDLDVFIDREKENIVIVDNSIMSFAFDLDNGVPIQSFMGNEEEDKELLFLISFLEEAFYTQDVRPSIREAFKLSYLMGTIENDTDAANAAKK
jgi:CTD small phosphatase-like protein 2